MACEFDDYPRIKELVESIRKLFNESEEYLMAYQRFSKESADFYNTNVEFFDRYFGSFPVALDRVISNYSLVCESYEDVVQLMNELQKILSTPRECPPHL